MPFDKRIVLFSNLKKIAKVFERKRTVLVGGCFEVFHFGHLVFLKKAREQGDFLIVALEGDRFIFKHKKRKPVHNQRQRGAILASLRMVDLVILLPYFSSDKNYFDLVEKVKPKVIAVVKGDPQLKNKSLQAKAVGGKVKIVTPLIKEFSASKILKDY